MTGTHGTMGYIAKEVKDVKEPLKQSDIFSLGIVFYELFTIKGNHPFTD